MIPNQSNYNGLAKVGILTAAAIIIIACSPEEKTGPTPTVRQTVGVGSTKNLPQSKMEASKMPIVDAKNAWEEKLMAIAGVNGVAIGLSADGTEKVIKVYVRKSGKVDRVKIPAQIEGYRVEIEPRGAFKAY